MQENETVKKSNKSFFVMAMVPILAIGASVFLAKKDINISTLVFDGFKEGELLGARDVAADSNPKKVFSAFEKSLKPVFGGPEHINIERLGISADVIALGVERDGTMSTPKDWKKVGWYLKSGVPGEDRNIVINGHFDDDKGTPAAFYALKDIKTDDIIEIKDSYGRIFSYKVVESKYVDIEDPERLKVLEDKKGKATLTMITCGGVWQENGGYNKRLIITADLL